MDGSVALPAAAVAIALPAEVVIVDVAAFPPAATAVDIADAFSAAVVAADVVAVLIFPLRPLRAVTRTGFSALSVAVSCGLIVPV